MRNAKDRGRCHAVDFLKNNRSYNKIFAKYAEVENQCTRVAEIIDPEQLSGYKVTIEETEDLYEDFEYYMAFRSVLADVIASYALEQAGYSKDEDGYWL